MASFTNEIPLTCPYCGSAISVVVESLYGDQQYVEDCEVCCRPIRLTVSAPPEGEEDEAPSVIAERSS